MQVLAPKGHTFTQGEEDSLVNLDPSVGYETGEPLLVQGAIAWEGIGRQGGV